MKIGIAQIQCTVGDIPANCERMATWARQAKDQGCEVVVFPEAVDTGYYLPAIYMKAFSWEGEPFERIKGTAREAGIHLVCGLSEREGDKIYNTMAVINPDGDLIGKYRKAHLASFPPLNEHRCYEPGQSLEIVTIGGMKWGFMICYDLRFPEMSRALALKGAEVLVLCSAWPFPRVSHWKTLVRARAIENQAYMLAANRAGQDEQTFFCGSSTMVDPYGACLSEASEDREELITGEINREAIASVRSRMPVFKHRRTDLY